MPTRRPLLKRVALWTGAIVLLLVGYVLGAPFTAYFGQQFFFVPESFFSAVYAPLEYVASDPNAPGHTAFVAYLEWTQTVMGIE